MWPELAAFAIPRFREVLETGVPWIERDLPLEVESAPGVKETRYYTYDISRFAIGDGTLLLDSATDVTGRSRARRPAESEAKYRNLFTNLIDGFALHEIVLDEHGRRSTTSSSR